MEKRDYYAVVMIIENMNERTTGMIAHIVVFLLGLLLIGAGLRVPDTAVDWLRLPHVGLFAYRGEPVALIAIVFGLVCIIVAVTLAVAAYRQRHRG